jgi:hemoglobin
MEAVVSESRKTNETSATRRTVVEGASAGLLATSLAGCATAADQETAAAGSLYQRLGGVFPIAAVVDHFSDALIRNPIVGQGSQNAQLREWHTRNLDRLPGLKFMRTLWVCNVSGGPFQYTPVRPGRTNLGLEEAHRALRISPAEFDEVAAELGRTLDHFRIPEREKTEVLSAFAAHKDEVTEGYRAAQR